MRRVEVKDETIEKRPDETNPKSMTGREFLAILKEACAIGMWKDRDDIGDSSEFARKLREKAQTREHE
jgi:hypothetical protein